MIIIYPSWMHNDLQVALVGTKVDLTYTYEVWCLCIVLCVVAFDSFSCMVIFVVYNLMIFISFSILVTQPTAWKRLYLESMRFQRYILPCTLSIVQLSLIHSYKPVNVFGWLSLSVFGWIYFQKEFWTSEMVWRIFGLGRGGMQWDYTF